MYQTAYMPLQRVKIHIFRILYEDFKLSGFFRSISSSIYLVRILIVFGRKYLPKMGSDNDRPDKDGDADEDQLQLSAETFSALQAFYKEQESREIAMAGLRSNSTDQQQQQQQLDEDWQLSQFWYDDQTAETLANEVVRAADSVASSASAPADDRGTKVAIACVSCPTLYLAIKRLFPDLVHEGELLETALAFPRNSKHN